MTMVSIPQHPMDYLGFFSIGEVSFRVIEG